MIIVSMLSGADKTRYLAKIQLFSKEQFSESIDPYEISEWTDDLELLYLLDQHQGRIHKRKAKSL